MLSTYLHTDEDEREWWVTTCDRCSREFRVRVVELLNGPYGGDHAYGDRMGAHWEELYDHYKAHPSDPAAPLDDDDNLDIGDDEDVEPLKGALGDG